MLTSVLLKRIRSIREAEVPLAPLTLIVGPNGSGKSTIIRSLYLCSLAARQLQLPQAAGSYEAAVGSGTLRYRGTLNAKLFTAEDIHRARSGSSLEMRLRTGGLGSEGEFFLKHSSGKPSETTYEARPLGKSPLSNARTVTDAVSQVTYVPVERISWVGPSPRSLRGVGRWRGVMRPLEPIRRGEEGSPEESAFSDELDRALEKVRLDNTLSEELDRVGRELFGIDWRVRGRQVVLAKVVDRDLGTRGVELPLHVISLGTRQFFPVLVHLLALEHGDTLLTEEPEISLHPKAQVTTGECLARYTGAKAGKQAILSTHSHYLVLGVCKAVREKVIPPADVLILDCAKGKRGTEITARSVDESGRIEGWIPSFTEVDEYLFQTWTDSIRDRSN